MAIKKKDTIYIDLEDDITSIVDKLSASPHKIVALVPPKRSTVLNSAVNMKLLKSAAADAGKQVVLVTEDPSLLALAAGAALFTSPNLHTKPSLPVAKESLDLPEEVIDGSELDMDAPVGELAGVHAASQSADEGQDPAEATDGTEEQGKRRFKIPNFESFRTKLFIGIGVLLLLLAGWWWAFFVAPQAAVSITAQTSGVDVEIPMNISTANEEVDLEKSRFPAEQLEIRRTLSQSFQSSGTKNVGEKASGPMTINNCQTSEDGAVSIPAGTIFTSDNGVKFESLEAATLPGGTFTPDCTAPGTANVTVRAIAPGTGGNLPADEAYDIDGVGSLVYGIGGPMTGGTDREVAIVAKKDIDEASRKLEEGERTEVLAQLKETAGEDLVVIEETYEAKLGEVTASPEVGAEAANGTVSAEATYTVLAVPREALEQAVNENLSARLEEGNQSIYEDGMDSLSFEISKRNSATDFDIVLSTEAFIGPELDEQLLKEEIRGQRYSEALATIESRPGVVEVNLELEPFWVFTVPRPDKVQIDYQIDGQANL